MVEGMKKLIPLLCVIGFLTGCGVKMFIPPKTNPIIQDEAGHQTGIYTIGTTAERRLVLISANPSNAGTFCAEASPDSIESLTSTFNGHGNVNPDTQSKAVADIQMQTALAVSSALATKRTQGLQFYRDASFSLCQSLMNKYIDRQTYVQQMTEVRKMTYEMIKLEIQTSGYNTKPEIMFIPAPAVSPPPVDSTTPKDGGT